MSDNFAGGRESNSFVVEDPAAEIDAAQILRRFNAARRQLSLNVAHSEGIGAGYDDVQVCWASINSVAKGDLVTITAMAIGVRGQRHLVEYVATCMPNDRSTGRSVSTELARARGWTLVSAPHELQALRPSAPEIEKAMHV